jgi:hypothetical protein
MAVETGTVSHGTMRPEDLIPTFTMLLRNLDKTTYDRILQDYGDILTPEDGGDIRYDDTDNAGFLLNDLFEALDRCAPEGFYFGALEGDGSDYGYWQVEDEED